jgi:hypothetical protein
MVINKGYYLYIILNIVGHPNPYIIWIQNNAETQHDSHILYIYVLNELILMLRINKYNNVLLYII